MTTRMSVCKWSDHTAAILEYATDYRAYKEIVRAAARAKACWCWDCRRVNFELWALAQTTQSFKDDRR